VWLQSNLWRRLLTWADHEEETEAQLSQLIPNAQRVAV